MADEQAAPSSIIPPAEEKHDAPKETVLGEDGKPAEPQEGVPVSTSGPVSEDKVQSALSEIPAPKTDVSGDDAHKAQAEKELKEKSPVGGSEAEAVEGSGGKPHEMKTVEQAQKEKEGEKKKSGEGGEEEKENKEEGKEETEANGPAPDEKNEEESKEAGDKRGAAAVTNGGGAEERAGKKAKKAEGAPPTTNGGGAAARGSKAKSKREPAPVGKTARRTRSQGLTES